MWGGPAAARRSTWETLLTPLNERSHRPLMTAAMLIFSHVTWAVNIDIVGFLEMQVVVRASRRPFVEALFLSMGAEFQGVFAAIRCYCGIYRRHTKTFKKACTPLSAT
jgi:hypothetical protein